MLAIPTVAINATEDVPVAFNRAVASALSAANYNVEFKTAQEANTVVLRGDVTKFNYWSYSWLWPFIFDGGGIRYDLVLIDDGGNEVWSQTFKAGSSWISLGGAYGYQKRIKKGMTRILVDIEEALQSEEFVAALKSHQASAQVQTGNVTTQAPAPPEPKPIPETDPLTEPLDEPESNPAPEPKPPIDESRDARLRRELEERMMRVTP
ncbi:MAG: hypothetical protein VCD00_00580 [Candidatus Hydrogenedentota bacterium]